MLKSLFVVGALLIGGICRTGTAQESGPNKDLVQYVRGAKAAGLKDTQIQQAAASAGWDADAIKHAMGSIQITSQVKAGQAPDAAGLTAVDSPPATSAEREAASAPGITHPVPSSAIAPPAPNLPAAPIASKENVDPDAYEIGAGDVLHVNVWGEPTASVNGAVVRPDGKISLPLIHDIQVLGLSPSGAEKLIGDQLSRFINSPDVAVIVASINSKKIYVTGNVKKEGPIPFTYSMRIMQAISEAGGLTPYAKRKKIYVLRNENGRDFKIPFDYESVLRGEHMEMNIPLKPSDQLIVP